MKFKIDRKKLLSACKKALKTASLPTKGTPELSGMLIEADAEKSTLKITSTDTTSCLQLTLRGVEITESGQIVVPALFASMLGVMDGEIAAITVNGAVLVLECDKAIFHLPIMSADKYPSVIFTYPKDTIRVSGLAMILRCSVSLPENGFAKAHVKPALQGVQVRFSGEKSSASSSDGARFVKSSGKHIADGELDIFISERAIKTVCKLVNPTDDIYIGKVNNSAVFFTAEFVFTSRLVAGDLNKLEEVLSGVVPKYEATVNADELLRGLDTCVSFVSGYDLHVFLTLSDDVLKLSASTENGEISAEVSVRNATDFNGKTFCYNPKYLLEFVKTCAGGKEIILEIAENGILKLKDEITDYVVVSRRPYQKKTEKKGKAAKTAA